MNLLDARLSGGTVSVGGVSLPLPRYAALGERDVTIGIRASEVRLADRGMSATVTLCELLGEEMIIDLDVGGAMLRAKFPARARLAEGSDVHLDVDPDKLHVFDRATGMRLDP
jgi:multiple sugar transport system ATP-binding protein